MEQKNEQKDHIFKKGMTLKKTRKKRCAIDVSE